MPDLTLDRRDVQNVLAAMITRVKLSGPATTAGEVRALLADEHVHSAVIVDDGALVALVDRSDLHGVEDDVAAVSVGCRDGRVVAPETDLRDARDLLLRTGRRRLAVVRSDGQFLGLLCLKRSRQGFCSDLDVHARSRSWW